MSDRNVCYFVLLLSVLLGTSLRFHDIGGQPLWLDEAYSHWFSTRSFKELWFVVPKYETNPPLYYTVLKIWGLFGSSEWWLRSLSAIISIGCIPLVFALGSLLGRPIGGERVGAVAALMFAISPVHIKYAQEARAYSMLTFSTTMTLCAILWAMRHPKDVCVPLLGKWLPSKNSGRSSIGWGPLLSWMSLILGTVVTLYSHNTSVLFVLIITAVIFVWFVVELELNHSFLVNSIISVFIVILSWGPYFGFVWGQTKIITAKAYIPSVKLSAAIDTLFFIFIGEGIGSSNMVNLFAKAVVFAFVGILAGVGLWNVRRHCGRYIALLILCAIIGPILLEVVISIFVTPIFLDRTLVYISVPFFIAIGSGLMALGNIRRLVLSLIIILAVFSHGTKVYYKMNQKEPWNKAVDMVAKQYSVDDVILFVPNNLEFPFSYYAKEQDVTLRKRPLPGPFPVSGPEGASPALTSNDIPEIDKLTDQKRSVWVITRREDLFDPENIVMTSLLGRRKLVSEWHFQGITVYKFV